VLRVLDKVNRGLRILEYSSAISGGGSFLDLVRLSSRILISRNQIIGTFSAAPSLNPEPMRGAKRKDLMNRIKTLKVFGKDSDHSSAPSP